MLKSPVSGHESMVATMWVGTLWQIAAKRPRGARRQFLYLRDISLFSVEDVVHTGPDLTWNI